MNLDVRAQGHAVEIAPLAQYLIKAARLYHQSLLGCEYPSIASRSLVFQLIL
ncbi:MAG: hypothetical protein ACK4IT_09570 [Thioalkalivibrionaceae bacterium]